MNKKHKYLSDIKCTGTYKQRLEKAISTCFDGDVLHESHSDGGWEVHFIHGVAFIFWQNEAPSNNPEFIGHFESVYYGDIADKLETLT